MKNVKKVCDSRRIYCLLAAVLMLSGCQSTPSTSSPTRSLDSYVLDAAQAAEKKGDYAGAATHYSSLYKAEEPDVAIMLGLARSLRKSGRTAEALRVMQQAPDELKNAPEALVEAGKLHLASGHPDLAVPVLERAIKDAPESWEAVHIYALTLDHLGQHELAQQNYKRAEELSPNNPDILNNHGLSYILTGDLDKAKTLLETAAAQSGANAQVARNLALVERLQAEKALSALEVLPVTETALPEPTRPVIPDPIPLVQ